MDSGNPVDGFILTILELIDLIINIFQVIIFVWWILWLLLAFNVIRGYNPTLAGIMGALDRFLQPFLTPIRRRLPNFGGLDLSPVVLLLLLWFAQAILWRVIAPIVL